MKFQLVRESVDKDVVGAFKASLLSLVDNYEEKDIYNMDESGLFWKVAFCMYACIFNNKYM